MVGSVADSVRDSVVWMPGRRDDGGARAPVVLPSRVVGAAPANIVL